MGESGHSMSSGRLDEAAGRAVAALRALRAAALAECGATDPGAGDGFRLEWDAGTGAEALAGRALEAAAEIAAERQAIRPGRVYCYDCQTSSCAHACPATPEEVFAGYEPTGRPRWCEFFNLLLKLGDPRTETRFAKPPQVLACMIDGATLKLEQLASFGRHSLTYRIWAQVVAGYLHVDGARYALTAQLVEGAGRELRLQVIADRRLAERLAESLDGEGSALARVHDALDEARHEVESLGAVWPRAHSGPASGPSRERAFGILRHLVHSIERKGRQQYRRTRHAEVRAAQQRPVHKACEDVLDAAAGCFFHDAVKHAIIVAGKAGRAHAFSPTGRLITSLNIGRDELDSRQRRRRYLPLSREEVERFREACRRREAGLAAAGGEAPGDGRTGAAPA